MNICCLTRITLAHEARGGMEVHVKTMSEGLVRSGHTVTIITTGHPKEVDHEIQEGVELYYCRGTIPGQYSQTWGDASLKLLSELHRKDAFDIVWGEGGGAYYYIRAARHQLKIPAVTFLQGSFIGDLRSQIAEVRSNRNLILLFAKQLPKRIYDYFTRDMIYAGRADAVIGSSRETARDARIEYFIGKNRIYASINGIDVQRFRPLQCKSEEIPDPFGIETGAPLIFTASRLTREKGIHILIQTLPSILKSIPNAMLLVAGVGPAEDQLKTLTRNLKINSSVRFLGYVPNDELVNYYNLCDVFVYPTLRYESFGISVAEAMACGRPVVAAKSGAIPSSIDHGVNGFLYRPHRSEQLSDLCVKLLKDSRLRERIGRSARRKAEQSLSTNRMIRDVLAVFEGLICQK